MAERFARGGRLLALGVSDQASSDARHVAVEFVHPVIVGKRALPALALVGERGSVERQVELLARGGRRGDGLRARDRRSARPAPRPRLPDARLRAARRRVGVRVAGRGPVRATGAGRDALPPALGALPRVLRPPRAARGPRGAGRCTTRARPASSIRSSARRARPRGGRGGRARVGGDEGARGGRAARADARRGGGRRCRSAARALRERLERGGKVLALGNGGSATDAMDAVADLRSPPRGWPARAARGPDRGPGDPHRDRERRGGRADLPAPGDRLRARRRTR